MATDLTKYIAEAETAFRAENGKVEGIPSSPAHDARLITWHLLYWTGKAPASIATSRGNSYRVSTRRDGYTAGHDYIVRITDYANHRNGVEGFIGYRPVEFVKA